MTSPRDLLTPTAVLIGLALGWFTALFSINKMWAGPAIAVIGVAFSAVIVTIIAKRVELLVSLIPVVVCTIRLHYLWYRSDSKYEGMTLAQSIEHRLSIPLVLVELVVALLVAGITYAIKKRAEPGTGGNR